MSYVLFNPFSALKYLPHREAEAFRLYFNLGLSLSAVGQELGRTTPVPINADVNKSCMVICPNCGDATFYHAHRPAGYNYCENYHALGPDQSSKIIQKATERIKHCYFWNDDKSQLKSQRELTRSQNAGFLPYWAGVPFRDFD